MTSTRTPDGPELANDLLERIGSAVGHNAKASAIFGEPVERDGITVIPVARAHFGFGGGAGSGPRESDGAGGGGGGGGASVIPIGYIELRGGSARFERIRRPADLLALAATVSLAALVLERLLGAAVRRCPRAGRRATRGASRARSRDAALPGCPRRSG